MESKIQLNPLTFPLWWYTAGFGIVWERARLQFRYGLKKTAFRLFLRNLRHPLYGDYTRSGRIISFFLRIFLLIVKLVFLGFRLVFLGVFLAAYIAVLPFALFMILYLLLPF
jgi:hypothetical protein